MNHPVIWQTPQPLWSRFGSTPAAGATAPDQATPAILRFDSDEFMEQMLAALEREPASLGERIARPETWRLPSGSPADLIERMPLPRMAKSLARLRVDQAPRAAVEPSASVAVVKENEVQRSLPLKLYQAAHQRYYLVAANLVCALPGLPDRALATGGSEQVGFVLRRMLPPVPAIPGVDRAEHAFVKDASGARWQRVGDTAGQLVAGEELLPLFSMGFSAENGRSRRLHAGMVPVGRREEYMSTRAQTSVSADAGVAATPSPVATRKEQFKLDVSEPWKNIVRSAIYARARIVDPGDGSGSVAELTAQRSTQATQANQQALGQSWLVLLDFADYLATHLPKVWACVETPALGSSLSGTPRALFDWLNSNETRPSSAWTGLALSNITLRDALQRIRGARAALEGATALYPDPPGSGLAWPNFSYLLAGVRGTGLVYNADGLQVSLAAKSVATDVLDLDALSPNLTPVQAQAEAAASAIDKLVQMVVTAIDLTQPAQPAPPLPFAARLRDAFATTQGDEGWFVMRCAYVRCDCGPLRPAVLSAPTSRFQLASFFDSDAPARPIRIALPFDTTPAGLRKHNKNAAFVMSDVLCGQVQRAKGLGFVDLVRSVLPWPLHKDLDVGGMGPCQQSSPQASLGMICSLSLPIITLCALIMLMIIVSLLDFIFRWMPYFVMCFPVPKLKGKKEST